MSIDMAPTSKDIEREADVSRAELAETLGSLKDKLTPGQIFDDLFGGSSANAGAFLKNLGVTMRDHPMPAVLIGAGLAMMLTGSGKGDAAVTTHPSSRSPIGSSGVSSVLDSARATAHDAVDGLKSASSAVGDTLTGIGNSAADAVDSLQGGLGTAAGAIKSGSSSVLRSGSQLGALVTDQPIIAASIGLALGAVLAAALPSTDVENSLMGSTSDAIKKQASDMAGDQVEKISAAAGAIADDVAQEAAAQGLTGETARQGASSLASKVAAVADKAGASIKQEAKKVVGSDDQGRRRNQQASESWGQKQ